jgi:predicted phosphodiesterase
MALQGDVVKKYLDKFPNTSSRALSRIIYNENKKIFTTESSAYFTVRYYRNAAGKRSAKNSPHLTPFEGGNAFPKLPEGITSLDNWEIVKITGDHNVLIMGDIHIPYHVKSIVEIAVKTAKKRKIDIVLLNGDIFDFFAISRWEKDPTKRDLSKEINVCLQFLEWLRHKFPHARIIFKHGNHEERYERYMWLKAPELLKIDNFSFPNLFHFSQYGIEEVKDMKPIKLNELFVIHGHEYKFSISNPVNPARGLYLRSKKNAITNHFHQSSSHSEKDIEDKVTTCWSLPCMCDLHPDYMPLNKHNHGFGIVETSGDKFFNVSAYKIIDGRIFSE